MTRAFIGDARPIIIFDFFCHMHQAMPNDGGQRRQKKVQKDGDQIKIINQLTFNWNGHVCWNSYASAKKKNLSAGNMYLSTAIGGTRYSCVPLAWKNAHLLNSLGYRRSHRFEQIEIIREKKFSRSSTLV